MADSDHLAHCHGLHVNGEEKARKGGKKETQNKEDRRIGTRRDKEKKTMAMSKCHKNNERQERRWQPMI